FDDSDADFKIQGSLTVTYPDAAGIELIVGNAATVTWNKTGSSILNAKVSYSTTGTGGPWTPIAESEGTPNDGIVANDGSVTWAVPDVMISGSTAFIKVEDPNDTAVADLSNNGFKIKGSLTFVTPAGGERWVTNENRLISWNTSGRITSVNLQHSKDNFATPGITIASGLANVPATGAVTYPLLNSYTWQVPNDLSTSVKVRILNASDTTVFGTSNAFTIDHYQIMFEVRDLLTNVHLDTLTVTGTNTTNLAYTWNASGLNSPITKGLQAGAWTSTWTKATYGDQSVSFVADRDRTNANLIDPADDPIQVFMETQVVHIWEAVTELAYNTSTDTVAIASTLRRDGSTVPGATRCEVKFYDAGTLIKNFVANSAPDAQGFYAFTWAAPTGLVAGKVYNVVTTINIASGGVFNTPRTFSVTEIKKLQDVQDTVNQKLDKPLSQVETAIQTKLDAQTTTLTTQIQTKLDQFSGQVSSSIISLESAASKSQASATKLEDAAAKGQAAALELEKVGKRYSGRLLVPTAVLLGEAVTLRYRAGEKLSPLIDISTADREGRILAIAKAQPMAESTTQPGLYEYKIAVNRANNFIAGKPFTVLVQESTTGNLEAGSVFVESTTLGSLEGLVAADTGAKRIAQETLDTIKAIQGVLSYDGDVGRSLENLKGKLDRLPKAIAEEGNSVQGQIKSTINQVAEQIKILAGDEGYDFSELVKKGLEESPTIGQIREKTDEVQGATEVMQVLMEHKLGGLNDPVVHVTYQ
ncbi:MAG: hypothetical protein ACRDH5_00310, partial [bacterium]